MELIKRLADPSTLTIGEKISGGLMVAVVGMTITFLALIFLWLVIALMAKLLNRPQKQPSLVGSNATETAAPAAVAAPKADAEDDGELVSVITAALATALNTSVNNIVVTKIVRVADERPAWSKVGLIEQINNRF